MTATITARAAVSFIAACTGVLPGDILGGEFAGHEIDVGDVADAGAGRLRRRDAGGPAFIQHGGGQFLPGNGEIAARRPQQDFGRNPAEAGEQKMRLRALPARRAGRKAAQQMRAPHWR